MGKTLNKTLNENNNNNNNNIIFRFKILLIDYLNELIDFSMSFPFYRRLNPLFDELFNKDTTLSIGRSIFCARARAGARRPGGTRARAKMLRPIDKGADIQLNNGFNH